MVFEATRLQFCTMTHTRKSKHESRYTIQKEPGGYYRWQKECSSAQRRIWKRQITTKAEVKAIKRNQVVEETMILNEIWRNQTREQEVQKELEKEKEQEWENNGIIYMEERIYISNNRKIQEQIL